MKAWLQVSLPQWIAWVLPRSVVRYVTIRLFAHASTREYSDRTPDAITLWEALDSWEKNVRRTNGQKAVVTV